jgi:hypothetical protein
MKNLIRGFRPILIMVLSGCLLANRGFAQQLISYDLIGEFTPSQIDSIYFANGIPSFVLPSTYTVAVYKVVYNTLDADSVPTIASGAFFIPVNPPCKVPLASYQHGTVLNKEEVPSSFAGGEVIIGLSMATDGYAVCMPDYLGLGDSPGLHPYVHAETEARAVADLLVSSLTICDQLSVARNEQLFLLGYSQGGHATMAAYQMIQEHYGSYFTVTACAPMSGPYDLSGVQAGIISSGGTYPNPGYLPYLLFAYNSVYHLYDSVSQYIAAPYDSLLPPLFDGTHEMDEVNAVMPAMPSEIIVPAVLDSFNTDPDYKLHKVLEENDTYFWVPQHPMRMYYCEGDQDVNYMNAVLAYDSFIAFGASGISLQSSGASFDHVSCALPSLLNAKFWLDSLRLDKLKLTFELQFESHIGAQDGAVTVHASSGYPPYTYLWSNGGTDSTITNVGFGNYTVTVTDSTGCPASLTVYLPVQVGIEEAFSQAIKIYPNPFSKYVKIELPGTGEYLLKITDVSSQLIQSKIVFGNEAILDRGNLLPGLYFLTVMRKDGSIAMKKLLVD